MKFVCAREIAVATTVYLDRVIANNFFDKNNKNKSRFCYSLVSYFSVIPFVHAKGPATCTFVSVPL